MVSKAYQYVFRLKENILNISGQDTMKLFRGTKDDENAAA